MVYKFKEHGALKSGKPTFESVGMVTNCSGWSTQKEVSRLWDFQYSHQESLGQTQASRSLLLLSQFRDDLGKFGPQFPHLESIIVVHLLGCCEDKITTVNMSFRPSSPDLFCPIEALEFLQLEKAIPSLIVIMLVRLQVGPDWGRQNTEIFVPEGLIFRDTVFGDFPKCHPQREKSKLASWLLLATVINHFVMRQPKHIYLFAWDQEDYGIQHFHKFVRILDICQCDEQFRLGQMFSFQ